jgi:hypothetical protein
MSPATILFRILDGAPLEFDLFLGCFAVGTFGFTWGLVGYLLARGPRAARQKLLAASPYRGTTEDRVDELRLVLGVGEEADRLRALALGYLRDGRGGLGLALGAAVRGELAMRRADASRPPSRDAQFEEAVALGARVDGAEAWCRVMDYRARFIERRVRGILVASGLAPSYGVRALAEGVVATAMLGVAGLGGVRTLHLLGDSTEASVLVPLLIATAAIFLAIATMTAIAAATRTPRGVMLLEREAREGGGEAFSSLPPAASPMRS